MRSLPTEPPGGALASAVSDYIYFELQADCSARARNRSREWACFAMAAAPAAESAVKNQCCRISAQQPRTGGTLLGACF
jgi:hypothetical protein